MSNVEVPKKKAQTPPWPDPSLDSERESDASKGRRNEREAERTRRARDAETADERDA